MSLEYLLKLSTSKLWSTVMLGTKILTKEKLMLITNNNKYSSNL